MWTKITDLPFEIISIIIRALDFDSFHNFLYANKRLYEFGQRIISISPEKWEKEFIVDGRKKIKTPDNFVVYREAPVHPNGWNKNFQIRKYKSNQVLHYMMYSWNNESFNIDFYQIEKTITTYSYLIVINKHVIKYVYKNISIEFLGPSYINCELDFKKIGLISIGSLAREIVARELNFALTITHRKERIIQFKIDRGKLFIHSEIDCDNFAEIGKKVGEIARANLPEFFCDYLFNYWAKPGQNSSGLSPSLIK